MILSVTGTRLCKVSFVITALFPAQSVLAFADPASICETAAEIAASQTAVPPDILRALTLTETGRSQNGTLRPWPWAINHAGDGQWFATEADLLVHAMALIDAGQTNFDLGCFQLNYRWHGQNFASLEDMTNPEANAQYAAAYLLSKHRETQDWATAIGAYHSATPAHANTYLDRFRTIYAQLGPAPLPVPMPTSASPDPVPSLSPPDDRPNQFPLLIPGESVPGPSLVRLTSSRPRLFGSD
jgi:hypothetical protein